MTRFMTQIFPCLLLLLDSPCLVLCVNLPYDPSGQGGNVVMRNKNRALVFIDIILFGGIVRTYNY